MAASSTPIIGGDPTYRRIMPTDFERIKALHDECFPVCYPMEYFHDICERDRCFTCCAEMPNKEIAGVLVARMCYNTDDDNEEKNLVRPGTGGKVQMCYIMTLGVSAPYRRNGIAHAMLTILMDAVKQYQQQACKVVYLHVVIDNNAAIALYERHKFLLHSKLPDYYRFKTGDKKDAYMFVQYVNGGEAFGTICDKAQELMNSTISAVKSCLNFI